MKRKYQTIGELIALLETDKDELEERIAALKQPCTSFEEELIIKYIETRSTVKAAEYVKSKGIKSPKGTVFASGDVSKIIKNGDVSINPVLLRIAKEIFDHYCPVKHRPASTVVNL